MRFENFSTQYAPSTGNYKGINLEISKLQSQWESPTSSPASFKKGILQEKQLNKTKTNLQASTNSLPISCDSTKRQNPTHTIKDEDNVASVVMIQKLMRGWWQRLQFRIRFLQYKLDTQKERTEQSIYEIQERLQKRKDAYREKKVKKVTDQLQALDKEAIGCEIKISHLLNENKSLKEKNMELSKSIQALRIQNKRLEGTIKTQAACLGKLKCHAPQIEQAHEKLTAAIFKYKSSIEMIEDKIEHRQHYCLAEHAMKVTYLKAIGNMVEEVENSSNQDDLTNEVVRNFLLLEEIENSIKPNAANLTKRDSV